MILQTYAARASRRMPMSHAELDSCFSKWERRDAHSAAILQSICESFQVWPEYVSELEQCCFPMPQQFGQDARRAWRDTVLSFVPAETDACSFAGKL